MSQLSHHLTHLNWRGAAQTAVLLVAVFSVWAYTSFEATSRDVERKDTQRTPLAVMFVGDESPTLSLLIFGGRLPEGRPPADAIFAITAAAVAITENGGCFCRVFLT